MLAMTNDTLTDVTLVSSDGVRIPASRFVLAARSEVFERMLYGHFREGSSDEVKLDYSAVVLRGIVEFCCTDQIGYAKLNEGAGSPMAYARALAQLHAAANYYELKRLADLVSNLLKESMSIKNNPALACTLYDESIKLMMPDLQPLALSIIVARPWECLLNKDSSDSCSSFSADSLKALVQVDEITECIRFAFVERWVGFEEQDKEERMEIAKTVLKDINLCHIAPKDLTGMVSASKLVQHERIVDAIREQHTGNDGVFIAGAGTVVVNGKYKEMSYGYASRDSAVYMKEAQVDGKAVKIFVASDGGYYDWHIVIIDADECKDDYFHPSYSRRSRAVLYHCRASSFGSCPPTSKWETMKSHAVAPSPTIIYPVG